MRLKESNEQVRNIEGARNNQWVLMDTGDIVVHIFLDHIREFYRLEHLWGHARVIPLTESTQTSEA